MLKELSNIIQSSSLVDDTASLDVTSVVVGTLDPGGMRAVAEMDSNDTAVAKLEVTDPPGFSKIVETRLIENGSCRNQCRVNQGRVRM